jgi:hypothetical protein
MHGVGRKPMKSLVEEDGKLWVRWQYNISVSISDERCS